MADFKLFTSLRYDPAILKAPDEGFTNVGWNQKHSPIYMLDLHRDRLLRAAKHWGWTAAIDTIAGEEGLQRLQEYIEDVTRDCGEVPHRVKVEISQDGTLSHGKSAVPSTRLESLFPQFLPRPGEEEVPVRPGAAAKVPPKSPAYEILVDTQPTAKSEFTHHKTTRRPMYDGARARAQLAPSDHKEVLLVNEDNRSIMEGSITTCYFWRGGRWVTPIIPQEYSAGQGSGGNDGTTRRWALER